jgi:hypothetical protein
MATKILRAYVNEKGGRDYVIEGANGVYDDDFVIVVAPMGANVTRGKLYIVGGDHEGSPHGDGAHFQTLDKVCADVLDGGWTGGQVRQQYIFRRGAEQQPEPALFLAAALVIG